eukprot:scaffold344846_cov18-Prasinocladus_malaysianus.AAC.1
MRHTASTEERIGNDLYTAIHRSQRVSSSKDIKAAPTGMQRHVDITASPIDVSLNIFVSLGGGSSRLQGDIQGCMW